MKMRKVLSLVLALALVLGSFSMAFASTYSDTAGTASDEAVNVLSELGVVNGYEDGTYKPGQVVTRAEAAKLIVAALGLTDYATGSTSNFKDMANYGWAQGFVGYAQALGILKGYGDGTYKPGATVTYNEMATIVVRALGYTDASLAGTWPANYVAKAKTLGIMDNITGGGGATGANRGDCAIMIYNALDLAIGTVDAENKWTYETKIVDDVTKYADTMFLRLGVNSVAGADVITYADAQDSVANITPYIGAFATTLQNKDGKIIAIDDMKSTFLTGKLQSNGKFKANGTEYSISATAYGTGAVTFLNADDGATTASITVDKEYTLAVKTSGTTIKNIYSVMTWDVTADDYFADSDAEDITDDNSLFGYDFPVDDSDVIDTSLFALNGVASLSDIAKDDVVFVYTLDDSATGDIIRVDVGTKEVVGKVTKKTSDNKYTIDGTVYSRSVEFVTASDVDAGKEVKAVLDYAGKIYEFKDATGGATDYATVISSKDGAGVYGDPKIQLIIADGTKTVFVADEEEVADAILSDAGVWNATIIKAGAIVKYSLDSKGVINDIVATTANYTSSGDITDTGYYASKKIATDVVVFTYDESGAGTVQLTDATTALGTVASDYDVTTRAKILDTKAVEARYVLKDNVIVAMLINQAASGSDKVYGVATDYATNSSDAGYEISVLVGGTAATYNAKAAAYDTVRATDALKALYNFTFDSAGNIKVELEAVDSTTTVSISTAILNNVINGTATLDDSVVVYKWDTSEKNYVNGRVKDINSGNFNTASLYDTTKTADGVYDIVLLTNVDAPTTTPITVTASRTADNADTANDFEGDVLTAVTNGTATYQWSYQPLAGTFTDIAGATSATYTVGSGADAGGIFKVVVTGTGSYTGTAEATVNVIADTAV